MSKFPSFLSLLSMGAIGWAAQVFRCLIEHGKSSPLMAGAPAGLRPDELLLYVGLCWSTPSQSKSYILWMSKTGTCLLRCRSGDAASRAPLRMCPWTLGAALTCSKQFGYPHQIGLHISLWTSEISLFSLSPSSAQIVAKYPALQKDVGILHGVSFATY